MKISASQVWAIAWSTGWIGLLFAVGLVYWLPFVPLRSTLLLGMGIAVGRISKRFL